MVLRIRKPRKVSTQVITWLVSLAIIAGAAGTLFAWFVPPESPVEIEASE